MSKDVECPYCGADVEINHDDGYGYEEDQLHEQEFGACEKVFAYTAWITVHHEAKKADCLNGAEHKYKRTVTYPPEFAKMRCTECGHETALPANIEVTSRPSSGD